MDTSNITPLNELYTPTDRGVVVEIVMPTKTKAGLTLSKEMLNELQRTQSPASKVVSIGPNVTHVKLNDYVIVNRDARIHPITVIHTDPDNGIMHAQCHEIDILGKVDSLWQLAKEKEQANGYEIKSSKLIH